MVKGKKGNKLNHVYKKVGGRVGVCLFLSALFQRGGWGGVGWVGDDLRKMSNNL